MPKSPLRVVEDTIAGPPGHLGKAGRALWASVQAAYQIADPGGLSLLQTAAEAADRVARCREQIDADGEVIYGRGGIPKAHPLLAPERDARSGLTRALKALALDVEPVKPIGRPPGSYR